MVNRSNSGRGDFPSLNLNPRLSEGPYQPNHTADVPTGAYRALAGAAEEIAQGLGRMGAAAAAREGRDQAVADAAAGNAQPQAEWSFRGASYNATARVALGGQMKAAILQSLQEAETQHPASPTEFLKAVQAIRAGYKPTGFAELDLDLQNFFELQTAASAARVRDGAEKVRQSTLQAGFLSELSAHQQLADQAAATAPFDGDGPGRVASAISGFASALAKYGPRSEFTVGGVTFPADENRLGIVQPDVLERAFLAAQSQTRRTWILGAAERLEGSGAKAAFVEQVRERWAAGDPVFAGLDGADVDKLLGELSMGARRAQADEQAAIAKAESDFRDYVQAFRYGQGDPDTLREMAQRTGNPGLIAQAEFLATADKEVPGVLDEVYARANGYVGDAAGAIDFVIDALEGGPAYVANDNGLPSKFGIRATHKDGTRNGKHISKWTREDARAEYKRIWDSIDADSLPPSTAFVAFQAVVNTGDPKMVKRWVAESGGEVAGILARQTDFYEELARKDPAKYGDDLAGWRRRVKIVAGKAAAMEGGGNADEAWEAYGLSDNDPRGAAWAATQTAFRGDPLAFAARKGLAKVPAVDVDAVFSNDANAVGGFAAALQQRGSLGQALARQYAVPTRYLTDAETAALKDRIAQDPTAAVVIARTATAALGGQGAQQVMRELGRDGGGVEIHIGDLATTAPIFAATAAEGLRLKAAGAKLPKLEDGDDFDTVQQQFAGAFAFTPDVLVTARQTAEAAMIADAAKGITRPPKYYFASALGATQVGGKIYGGPHRVNGAMTLLPRWLSRDDADEALERLADAWTRSGRGPVYSNGKPMSARDVARLQLVARPDGRYWLRNPTTGAYVRGRDGKAFAPDLDQSRGFLEEVMPGAVLGGGR